MSELVAELRADHRALDRRVERNEKSIRELDDSIETKHKETRHAMLAGQQVILDKLHLLEVKWARAAGWAAGAGAIIAVIIHFVEKVLP